MSTTANSPQAPDPETRILAVHEVALTPAAPAQSAASLPSTNDAPGAFFETFVARAEWLSLILALAAIVLIYPLELQDVYLQRWFEFIQHHPGRISAWLLDQIHPLLQFQFSPLILKGAIAAVPMIAFIALHAARRLWFPSERINTVSSRPHSLWLGWAAFFAWTIASAFWGPTRPLSIEGGIWGILYGIFGWTLLRRGFDNADLRRLAIAFVWLGVAVIIVLHLEASPLTQKKTFLILHQFDDERNLFGTLLGHNTAAASFLLMTAFPALALMLSVRTNPGRMLYGFYLVALLYGIIILQSRAIWILGMVLLIAATPSMLRLTLPGARRWVPTLLLAAAALGLFSQAIDASWNPLYVANNPLARRLHDLSPERLGQEARMRLNYLGVRLVPEHPFFGSGLYTFQYEFPAMQGEYFWNTPDSKLAQTPVRSHMAHDEYLQVLIEEGIVGLALLAWLIVQVARSGSIHNREFQGNPRLIHEAFGWSALGFLLHACVDFPFHVPPLALCGVVCMAAWGAATGHNYDISPGLLDAAPENSASPPGSSFRIGAFARLLAGMVCIAAIPFATYPFARILQGDCFYGNGNGYLGSLQAAGASGFSTRQKVDRLLGAVQAYSTAVQLVPSHGLAWQRLGDAKRILGMIYAQQKGDDKRPDPKARAQAFKFFGEALAALDHAGSLLDYGLIYYYRALVYVQLSELYRAIAEEAGSAPAIAGQPAVEGAASARLAASQAEQQYRRNLLLTLHYNAPFVQAAYELAERIAADTNPDMNEVVKLRAMVLRFDPHFFSDNYSNRANVYLHDQRYDIAAASWEQILMVDPKRTDWLSLAAYSELHNGNRARAAQLLRELTRLDPKAQFADESGLELACIEGRWFDARFQLTHISSDNPRAQARLAEIESITHERDNTHTDSPWFARPAEISEAQWVRLRAEERVGVELYLMGDGPAAKKAFEARLALDTSASPGTPPPAAPPVHFWIDALYAAAALNDHAMGRTAMAGAIAANPVAPALPALAARLGLPLPPQLATK